MTPPPDPATQEVLQRLLLALFAFFLAGDVLIVALWVVEALRRRPILARTWSTAHLFLALQAVGAAVVAAGLAGMVVAFVLDRSAVTSLMEGYTPVGFFAVLLPSMLAQQVALVAIPAALVCFIYRDRLADLGLRWPDRRFWQRFGHGFLIAVALLPINDLIETVTTYWLLESGRVPFGPVLKQLSEQASAIRLLADIRSHPLPLACLVAIIAFIGPVAEEVFFRGFAYGVFKRRWGMPAALGLSALLFAAIHGNPLALFPIFVMGLVLAWTYERTGSLAAPIGIHCANNLLVVMLYLFAPDFSFWKWLVRH